MSREKILWGVLAGAAAGVLLGVLLAPDKGSETRKKIRGKSLETAEDIKNEIENLLDTFAEKLGTVKEKIPVLCTDNLTQAEDVKNNAKTSIN